MLEINIFETKEEMGSAAAEKVVDLYQKIIKTKSKVRFVAATGASQFEFLTSLTNIKGINWNQMEMFHLDEYIGLPETHIASFRKFLKERLTDIVNPQIVHFIKGNALDPLKECNRINKLISKGPIDIAFVGIGENGHLAFNDPPADFEVEDPYIIVNLDQKCRQQQVGEGWFNSIEEVPTQAISMSIKQILKAENIICVCPEKRKAEAVKNCLAKDAKITNIYPASILKKHSKVFCYLDKDSASFL
ncbi:MAG: glucosamine-6-phosphate deaminase [Promethearchaeota archaeon]